MIKLDLKHNLVCICALFRVFAFFIIENPSKQAKFKPDSVPWLSYTWISKCFCFFFTLSDMSWSFFKRKVRKQNLENSFTFCELIRPPKYVRFPNTRDVMPENFVNHLDKINSINRVIKTFNNATRKTNSLSFASRGTRSRGTKRTCSQFK